MSRIGRLPIAIPGGVTVSISDRNVVAVKGPKGELSQKVHEDIKVEMEDGVLNVIRPSDNKEHRSMHGLYRSLINNMVQGVTTGFSKKLELAGTGYRAQMQGKKLVLSVGYSHPVEIEPAEGISFETPAQNRVVVNGIDKQQVGDVAAKVRAVREPEPYLGKGIRYEGEVVRRKEGKAGAKK